jgi:hypothetical protein
MKFYFWPELGKHGWISIEASFLGGDFITCAYANGYLDFRTSSVLERFHSFKEKVCRYVGMYVCKQKTDSVKWRRDVYVFTKLKQLNSFINCHTIEISGMFSW